MLLTTISTVLVLSTSLAIHGGYNVVVDAHGYLKSPRSRNYVASVDPIWWGGTEYDPAPENCPHCLNIGGTEARCGKVGKLLQLLVLCNCTQCIVIIVVAIAMIK